MPDWLVERGIGETRCASVEDGEIVEARILLDGLARSGDVLAARLKSSNPAVAIADGQEYLLPKGAPGVTEGAMITIEVVRERIPGTEPWKRPLARIAGESSIVPSTGGQTLPFPSPDDPLGKAGWNDLVDEARSGIVRFAGGELRISPTPAMTMVDVDGHLPAGDLAIAGAAAAAKAIRRLDIGGSIGIDLPTTSGKTARQAAAKAIDAHLPQPFERTAVNGFGFVQIVRPRRRASLVELGQDRASFEARALLRRVAFEPPGAKSLVAHPAVIDAIRPEWIDALAKQIGGAISLRPDGKTPMSGGHAVNV
ncbi:MAG: ribonuclease [Pseudomonadota bacterium]